MDQLLNITKKIINAVICLTGVATICIGAFCSLVIMAKALSTTDISRSSEKEALVLQTYSEKLRLNTVVLKLKEEYKDPRPVEVIIDETLKLNGVVDTSGGITLVVEPLREGQAYYIRMLDNREEG